MSEDNLQNTTDENRRKNQKPLFSDEERESTVRAFIEAWNSHDAYVDHTRFSNYYSKSLSEINLDKKPKIVTVTNATSAIELTNMINNKIKIASGGTKATPETIYETINSLYNDIGEMQGRHLLVGKFLSNDAENRIFDRVMKKVDAYFIEIKRDSGIEQ